MYIASPDYPKYYPPGTSCRYHIIAPLDHKIYINCSIKFYKDDCRTDYFEISTEGDRTLSEYASVCNSGNYQWKSLFNKMTIAYTSSSQFNAGSFSCYVTFKKQECDCGWSLNTKIVGGVETGLTEYPFMAGLMNEYGTLFCGGSIISHRIILTAAHCLNVFNPTEVIVGAHDITARSKYTKYYPVGETRKHAEYNSITNDNDIAIVATREIIQWSRGVGPICLPLYYINANFAGQQTDFAGWGTIIFGGPRSNVLLKTTVDVVHNSKCGNENINSNKICTFAKSHDSCQFDSGGPVIWKMYRLQLLGIISYGKACGGNSPAVNTRITSYLGWIKQNTGDTFCAKY